MRPYQELPLPQLLLYLIDLRMQREEMWNEYAKSFFTGKESKVSCHDINQLEITLEEVEEEMVERIIDLPEEKKEKMINFFLYGDIREDIQEILKEII